VTIRELWRERSGIDAPRKMVCVGLNYRDHAAEQGRDAPAEPLLFAKLASALIEPGEAIVLPPEDDRRRLSGRQRRQCPDAAAHGRQWLSAKSFDTFCLLLPALVGAEELGDASGLRVMQRPNRETLQDASTDDFLFDVSTLIAHMSAAFARAGRPDPQRHALGRRGIYRDPPLSLQDGDTVEIEIEGIGALMHPVVAAR